MFETFEKELLKCSDFVVCTHIRPDGDGIGSQLALGTFLRNLGKNVTLFGADDTPRNIAWMKGVADIEVFDGSPGQLIRMGEADAVVLADANTFSRTGQLESTLSQHNGTLFVIDHHPNPDPVFHHMLVDTARSSTGEIVFEMFEHRDLGMLTPEAAEALYVAILTDTGSFRFNTVSPRVHEITAQLLEIGSLSPETIHNRVYKTRSFAGQRLLGQALATLQLVCDDRAGIMYINRSMLDRTGAHTEDAEGFTDHILAIDGVEVAIFAMQVGDHVKLSLRSQGDIPVNSLAVAFGGGGHFNASGAFVRGGMQSVLQDVKHALDELLTRRTT